MFQKTRQRLTTLWFNFGLTTRMTVIVVVGSIALLALFTYLGTAALDDSTQRSLRGRVILAQAIAQHLDYVIAHIGDELVEISAQELWTAPTANSAALERAYRRLDCCATRVFLLDASGRALAAYPPITATVSFDQFAVVAAARDGQPFGISRYSRPVGALGAMTIAVSPTRDESGEVVGALAAQIDMGKPSIAPFRQPIGVGETGYMDLVDFNGSILASTRRERVGLAGDHGETLAGAIRDHRQVVSACHNCHIAESQIPEREVLAIAPLANAQWGVTIRQSEDEVFAMTRQLQTRIFALMAIMLAGALVLVYLTTRSVIAPVQSLTNATERIATGDLQTPILALGRDEISTLARSFDAMRVQLRDSIEEIQKWNRELETRVQDGTAACRTALQENTRLYGELQQREQLRRELLHRLIGAQEEERKRISRELHDETCQILTGLEYALDNAAELAALAEITPQLEQMRAMTETAVEGVHRLILDLRPDILDNLGLIPALRWFAEARLSGSGIEVRTREIGELSRLPAVVETALFRVVQEAINNIARHSGARNAEVVFTSADQQIEIRIADDGCGFDPTRLAGAPDGKRGLGLMGMQERMSVIGGEFQLCSAPGKGTVIRLTAPIQQGENEQV
ncbi:MAG: HAMP domain-containing protein [Chloroflexi bacterium]|nr:HAMP domain-containing protein [Chloroflexota bacterium]